MPFLDAKALESDPVGMAKLKAAISPRETIDPPVVVLPPLKPVSRAASALGRLSLRIPLRRAVAAL